VNRLLVIALAAAASLAVHADFADAARMGGGRSFGMQRSIAPPAARAPGNSFAGPAAKPVMPATPGATASRPAAGAAVAPAGASRWLGPLAGVAAGLGLAALFSHFGLSEGFGSLLLIGLLVIAAVALMRAFIARRSSGQLQYAGAQRQPIGPAQPRDAFAPPRAPALDAAWGSPASDTSEGRYPPGFDPAPFLAQAKQQFRRLQAAYDRGDRALLADVTTPEMREEITREIATRGPQVATDVVTLDADVVEVVQEGDRYVASVRFHGTLREDGHATPEPFEELWHLVKPVDGSSGWLLAGIQQYA
jgi:predicted lipid-binding transport protein (Tim44 family)